MDPDAFDPVGRWLASLSLFEQALLGLLLGILVGGLIVWALLIAGYG